MSTNLQIVSVIAVIRNNKGNYLFVQRAKNDDIFPLKWQNLGEKIELFETVEEALRREIKEEIGLALKDINPIFLQSYSWKKDEKGDVRLGLIFLIELDEDIRVKISKELNDYDWFSFEQIEGLDTIGKDSPTGTLGQIKQAELIKVSDLSN